ncbi:SDR family oxidoreductase [Aquimarina sp. ERC-38]|uniref:SDR family NAD(P)-dependent oxidoreductase n=1 Tax=Aquimarina sp. ERC-38 TaxID=2949996 RepID=UPI0022486F27|nr:SDR family oxidoreductase [Aquimarina sp. ERC-38]UZO82443.1 SDR family oxidoreductase [Aquimarina sp. ERC-38]
MKNIIVTGTSRGIGFELVKNFAAQDHQVLALSRNEEPVNTLKLENVTTLAFDLAKSEDTHKVAQFVENNWKTVDVLIHNAGLLVNKPFLELSLTDFEKVYQVNVFGVAMLSQKIIPFMNTGGHVLTVSSMGGIRGSSKFPGLTAYSSSKGAVITLNEVLAEEFKEQKISFNTLAIGAVQTEMLAEAFPGYEAPLQAHEMAEYIANFAMDGAKYYNGKTLEVSSTTP